MTVESATYIHQLDVTKPDGLTDQKKEGDNHLRLIKLTLTTTFPAVTGEVLASHVEMNQLVGIGSNIQNQLDNHTTQLAAKASRVTTGGTTGKVASLDANGNLVDSGKVAANIAQLSSGVLPIAQGGTGASSASTARDSLGLSSMATQAFNNVSITGGYVNAGQMFRNNYPLFGHDNDGAGSGLDADLLDGQQGSYYAPIASPVFTGSPQCPTQSSSNNSSLLASTSMVQAAITALTTTITHSSLGANGYVRFKNGFQMVWGSASMTTSNTTVTYPRAFTSAPKVFLEPNPSGGGFIGKGLYSVAAASFVAKASEVTPMFFFAIGYASS